MILCLHSTSSNKGSVNDWNRVDSVDLSELEQLIGMFLLFVESLWYLLIIHSVMSRGLKRLLLANPEKKFKNINNLAQGIKLYQLINYQHPCTKNKIKWQICWARVTLDLYGQADLRCLILSTCSTVKPYFKHSQHELFLCVRYHLSPKEEMRGLLFYHVTSD